jgi:hypothetical protein
LDTTYDASIPKLPKARTEKWHVGFLPHHLIRYLNLIGDMKKTETQERLSNTT